MNNKAHIFLNIVHFKQLSSMGTDDFVMTGIGENSDCGFSEIGKPYDDIIFEWEDFYNSRIGKQPDVSSGSLNTHTASYVG